MVIKHLALSLLIVALLAEASYADVDMEVLGPDKSYVPGTEHLDSNISVTYDELIPKTASLYVYFNQESSPRGEVSLANYVKDDSQYTFRNQSFIFNITASGSVRWYDYPEQGFWYRIDVRGLCGGDWCDDVEGVDICDCPCGTSYPCSWSISRTSFREDMVNGNPELTGLKLIEDASDSIGIPENTVPGSVVWSVVESQTNPQEVDLTMREACGLMRYDSSDPCARDGWITKGITPLGGKPCADIPGSLEGTDCKIYVDRFDDLSMTAGYTKYGGPWYPGGGVYKNGDYQEKGTEVDWNGTSGEITLKDFDSKAYYYALYLPPNGPMVCAYTSYRIPNSSDWDKSCEVGASVGYLEPYTRDFLKSELNQSGGAFRLGAPDCPGYVYQQYIDCNKEHVTYGVDYSDPDGYVEVTHYYDTGAEKLTVSGATQRKILSGEEAFRVDLSPFGIDISDLTQEEGSHTMRLVISDSERLYGEESFTVFTCSDGDGDGYCTEDGDCNDSNPEQNPGMTEVCNGLDDDCNGVIDDGIAGMGENLGKPCWDWPGSACKGVYVCNSSGTGLVCLPNNGKYPGDMEEICDNQRDDDCDTYVDEENIYIDNVLQTCLNETMMCYGGETRPCGICRDGRMSCINGKWGGPCVGASEPRVEECNQIDDDCDGTIDNLYGKGSVSETKCQCYGGGNPRIEECNGIDDDCDGEIDEGAADCCSEGETRTCNTNVGRCEFGIQSCHDGQWGECKGAVLPELEVCCNSRDDDCDGEVDEDCDGTLCNTVNINDASMLYWTMIGTGVIILIGVLIYTEFVKKRG